ncbi:MAG: VOC family protein [Rhodobiaceae bacterium]|nr:VOC family protein [Rhodobiaceae bacterium]
MSRKTDTQNPTSHPLTQGAHHIGLTIPSVADTKAFFLNTLGYTQVGEVPDYPAAFLSDGTTMITLWQAKDPATATAFDRKNVVGLHHLALKVSDRAALATLHGKIKAAPGCEIEFAPESLGGGDIHHLMCTIPGGIRVEFIAPKP